MIQYQKNTLMDIVYDRQNDFFNENQLEPNTIVLPIFLKGKMIEDFMHLEESFMFMGMHVLWTLVGSKEGIKVLHVIR